MKYFFLSSHAHFALDPEAARVSGGAELQVALLARELAWRGNEVVITGGDTGQQDGRILDGVITRTGGRFHTGGILDTALALPRIVRLLREYRPDYVVILGWTAWLAIMAELRSLLGFKLIFICGLDTEIDGSFGFRHGWRGRLFERGVVHSDLRFAMSWYQQELFQRRGLHAGFYRNLVLQRIHPRIAKKKIDLLWVGRCQQIKRPHLFLDLVERLPESRCEMICPREDVALWNEIAARAGQQPHLTFRERVPYNEIQEHFDRARFLVSTSEAEGFPNVMIQAAQGETGIISLALDPDGLIERFQAGYCAEGDFEKLVTRTAALLADSERSEQMGRGVVRMLGEWFDNKHNVDSFMEGLR